ncbi:hypothetical protein C9J03_05350 [Photobacterium gaetbulicola]|uniref:hypothetical protein n=1 Tax=Photobacterium gaetbulicola TaxID=1295392 RepID=UPI0005CBB5BA|nr:hypothetical protein [Photobacterium gaetbulicola]PSU13848.1 hypothetical protein C9J03_05350 [Photobacterium gaetbulicola]
MLQLKEVKLLFDAGVYKEALVTRALMQDGYNLHLIGVKKSDNTCLSSQRASSEAKTFRSADAAISAAKDIGFRELKFVLS